MPPTNKFNVSAPEPVQTNAVEPPPAEQNPAESKFPRRAPTPGSGSNGQIKMLPSEMGELRDLIPSGIFAPNYKNIGFTHFSDGTLAGVLCGAESVMIRGNGVLGLYMRTRNLGVSTVSMSCSDLKTIMRRYQSSTRVIAILGEDDMAPIVGLRIWTDPRLDDKNPSILFTIGPVTTPSSLSIKP